MSITITSMIFILTYMHVSHICADCNSFNICGLLRYQEGINNALLRGKATGRSEHGIACCCPFTPCNAEREEAKNSLILILEDDNVGKTYEDWQLPAFKVFIQVTNKSVYA